jgi:hypothetical protein
MEIEIMNKESENDKILDNIFSLLNTEISTEETKIDIDTKANEEINNVPNIDEEGQPLQKSWIR